MRTGQAFHSYRLPVEASREFTPVERKVARMMAAGMSDREIAAKFGLTYYGIRGRIRKVKEKSGMSSRLEFVLWYRHHFPKEFKRPAETVLRTSAV